MVARGNRQRGYVALISVLIVGAAATAIGLALLSIGADAARSGLITQQGQQARSLASACAEEALQAVHDNVAYTGTTNIASIGQGSCSYTVAIATPTTRTITASGTVGNTKRKIQSTGTLAAGTLTTNAWTEVGDAYSAVTQVQNNTYTNDTGSTTLAQTFYANTTAGNLIVAAITWDTNTAPNTVTCSDSKGDSYTTINVWIDATNKQSLALCYASNIAGGTTTVTATLGANNNTRRMIISEYSGVAASSPVDVSTGVGGVAGTTTTNGVTSGSVTPTQNGDLIYAATMDTGTATTIAAGTTAAFSQRNFTNNKDLAVEDYQQGNATTVAGTWTYGTAQRYNAAVVAFKPATQ
ncbi:MAG TPA: hypothetical protein VF466_02830 [Candidatus Saccharimonadales bacterium]